MITTINEWKIFESSQEKWYHGSDSVFSDFEHRGTRGPSALGIFATTDSELAELFGSNVYEVDLSYSNPYTITQDKWDSIRSKYAGDKVYFSNWRQELINAGYDALFIQERNWTASSGHTFSDPKIIAIFDPKGIRIKQKVNESIDTARYIPQFYDYGQFNTVTIYDVFSNTEVAKLDYEVVDNNEIFIELFEIDSQSRGLGLAAYLYNAFERHIAKFNIDKIRLNADPLDANGDRDRLIALYKRFGFIVVDDQGPYTTMEKIL